MKASEVFERKHPAGICIADCLEEIDRLSEISQELVSALRLVPGVGLQINPQADPNVDFPVLLSFGTLFKLNAAVAKAQEIGGAK